MDYSEYPDSGIYYGGSERKVSINACGTEYMLKFRRRDEFGVRNNHISEYVGSHVFSALGIAAQETHLGFYRGEEVVACQNFLGEGEQFIPFNEVGESTLEHDKELYQYEYSDIMQMLHDNSKLTEVDESISLFWDMFIVDALLGNFDRHGSNWGFIRSSGAYRLAPVFDNGSCLYPRLVDEGEMKEIMGSQEETDKRVFRFPTSQVKLRGRKSSYAEVIGSMEFPECNHALIRLMRCVDMDAVDSIVNSAELATDIHKEFMVYMLHTRYEKILVPPYLSLTGGGL